jgi:hypothetical protein
LKPAGHRPAARDRFPALRRDPALKLANRDEGAQRGAGLGLRYLGIASRTRFQPSGIASGIIPSIVRSIGSLGMPTEAKVQENRVRRALHRQGYSLVKCRARDPRAIGFGQYFITDRRTNSVIAGGATQGGFDLTLDDAERWAFERL